MKVLLKEKHIALNSDCTAIYLKTGASIELQDFLCGVFIVKATITEHEKRHTFFYLNIAT